MDDELSFCRMVLIDNRNNCISSKGVHLVRRVTVHLDLYEIGVLGISIRRCHFLNAVVATF